MGSVVNLGNKKRGLGGRVGFFLLQLHYITQQWGVVTFLQKYIVLGISGIGHIRCDLPLDRKFLKRGLGFPGSRWWGGVPLAARTDRASLDGQPGAAVPTYTRGCPYMED
jgi:hypothetical protein